MNNKIILVFPNQIYLEQIPFRYKDILINKRNTKRIAPLGMLSLLCNSVHDTIFIDNYIEKKTNKELIDFCINQIGTHKGVVAFGGTCVENPQAVQVSQELRKKGIKTIYGGPNATVRPQKHINDFDFVICGVGVRSFGLLVNGIFNNERVDEIPGVCFDGQIKTPNDLSDLNDYKWPSKKDIPKRYKNQYQLNSIITSIGCPFECAFCASKQIWNRKVYFRSPDSVIDEVKSIGCKVLEVRDDNFSINKERLLWFCRKFKKLGIRWSCQARVSSLNAKIIQTMKDSGCVLISCGFESGNDSTLKIINKGHTVSQMREIINIFEKIKINYSGGFIVGFPNENEKEILDTVSFVKENRKKSRYSKIPKEIMGFLGFPKSQLYNQIIEQELVEYNWQDGEILFPKTNFVSRKRVESLARG